MKKLSVSFGGNEKSTTFAAIKQKIVRMINNTVINLAALHVIHVVVILSKA